MNKQCSEEIGNAELELFELEQQQNSATDFKKHIDTIRKVLKDAERDAAQGIISKDFVDRYIDKIFITPEEGKLRLEIKVFTVEITSKYLANLRNSTGHTFKEIMNNANRHGLYACGYCNSANREAYCIHHRLISKQKAL